MAAIIVTRGLLRIGQQASESTNYNAARNIQTMAIDIGATPFAAGHTKLNDSADVTESASSYFDQVFTATPTETAPAVITHSTIIPTGSGNFIIRRISLHDDTAANVTASSTTLVGGVDGQSLTKTSDFTLTVTLRLTYTSI